MGVGVGLDIGTDSIKVVSVRASGSSIALLSAAKVRRNADGSFPAAGVITAMRRAGISRRVTLGASGKDVMLRYIPVPPVPPWRMKMLVEFEIRENMAGGGADVTTDYRPLNVGGGQRGGILVLTVICKNAYLEERFSDAGAAHMKVNGATPNAVALARGFIASDMFKSGETTFMLDIGREVSEMAIQKEGDILFARNTTGNAGGKVSAAIDSAFGIGAQRAETYKCERARLTLQPPGDGDKRQLLIYSALREAGDAVVGSVTSGLRFARMQTKMKELDYDRLILSGGGARLAGLKEFLENRLKKPVILFDPAAAFEGSRLREESSKAFGGAPSEMAVATGLAVVDAVREGFNMSLLPPKVAASRHFWRRTVYGYAAGGVAAILAGTMMVRASTDLASATEAKDKIDKQLVGLRNRAKTVKQLEAENLAARNDMALLVEEARTNRAAVEFVALQRKACPDGLSLTTMMIVPSEEPGHVGFEFEGTSRGFAQAAFLEKLEEFKTALLANRIVVSAQISEAPTTEENVTDGVRLFKCRAEVNPWAPAEVVEAPAEGPAGDDETTAPEATDKGAEE